MFRLSLMKKKVKRPVEILKKKIGVFVSILFIVIININYVYASTGDINRKINTGKNWILGILPTIAFILYLVNKVELGHADTQEEENKYTKRAKNSLRGLILCLFFNAIVLMVTGW